MERFFFAGVVLFVVLFSSCKKDSPSKAINKAPVANAGPDQTIMQPQDNTRLNGGLSHDPDGSIVSYQWTAVAGLNSPNIDKDRKLMNGLMPFEMFVSELNEGVYQFELLVADNDNAVSRDTMKVTVLPDSLTRDPSKFKRYNALLWEDSCAIRISNILSAIPATGSIRVYMASYFAGGPMPVASFLPSSGWYQIQPVRSAGFWYQIRNDVLFIYAAANINCDWDAAAYDVLVKWN